LLGATVGSNVAVSTNMAKQPADADLRLPSFMLIDAKGKWIFMEKPKRKKELQFLYDIISSSNGRKCETVELLPELPELQESGYYLYSDEEGMLKMLPMNVCANPLCTEYQLCYMAQSGGPYGALVLFRENHDSISALTLRKLAAAWDEKMIENEEEEEAIFVEMLEKAITEWTSSYASVKTTGILTKSNRGDQKAKKTKQEKTVVITTTTTTTITPPSNQ
jgi:hypothetical protein